MQIIMSSFHDDHLNILYKDDILLSIQYKGIQYYFLCCSPRDFEVVLVVSHSVGKVKQIPWISNSH